MSAGKIILLVFGIIGLLISIGLLVGGGTLLWADNTIKDSEGFYTTETIRIEKDSYAIVTGPADISPPPILVLAVAALAAVNV